MYIYADNAATTKTSQAAIDSMVDIMNNVYGNPSSLHTVGQKAKEALEKARVEVAQCLGADFKEIYFTSGGSEADNQAIISAAKFGARKNKKHIISTKIEHHAVLHTLNKLEKEGFEVTLLDIDESGIVKPEDVEKAIREDTALVTIMYANNEIGTIQPIENVCEIAHEYGAKVHSDAVAAFGHIDVDVKKLGVDFLNVSGHKICGPKGVGFLYVRGGKPERFMHGGGQENGLRAGTENVAGIAGLATAARIAYETLSDRARQEKKISDYMIKRILREIPYSRINGSRESRVTGNMNFSFQYVNGGMLVVMLNKQGICASAGSACTSNSGKPSHVLLALGLDEKIAEGSLRLTINHTITHREADYVVECIKKDVARLRELA